MNVAAFLLRSPVSMSAKSSLVPWLDYFTVACERQKRLRYTTYVCVCAFMFCYAKAALGVR